MLYPSRVYLRTSSNKGAAGFKPYTKCTENVTSIHQDSSLRYEYFGLWLVARGPVTSSNNNVASLTQKNIEYFCRGEGKTDFRGTTLGTIVSGGKTYYSRVYTEVKNEKCQV